MALLMIGVAPLFPQAGRKAKLSTGKASSDLAVNPDNSQTAAGTQFEGNTLFFISFDLGKAGLQIPAFTDLNSQPQDAFKIKSRDFMLQMGVEQLFAKSPIHGPFVMGIKTKMSLAYSYWPTQQGDGEPGNYFASNGSYQTAGTYLHSGDIINIYGLRYALAPDLFIRYRIADMLEAGASVGPCLFGYIGMTIKDPWTGYSTSISDTETVGNSAFLTKHFKTIALTVDWSANIALITPGKDKKVYFELGMSGNSFFYGIGFSRPVIKTIK